MIINPEDGLTTKDTLIVVYGRAAPGSTITRDIPMWFDEHTIADANGLWSFTLGLNLGENVFTFRVGDDVSTVQTLTVHCVAN